MGTLRGLGRFDYILGYGQIIWSYSTKDIVKAKFFSHTELYV